MERNIEFLGVVCFLRTTYFSVGFWIDRTFLLITDICLKYYIENHLTLGAVGISIHGKVGADCAPQ